MHNTKINPLFSILLSNIFILDRDIMDLEPIPGTLNAHGGRIHTQGQFHIANLRDITAFFFSLGNDWRNYMQELREDEKIHKDMYYHYHFFISH